MPVSARGACDVDAIAQQVERDLAGYALEQVKVGDGIVTILVTARTSDARISVALHATGPRLHTSIAGGDADDAALAAVGGVVAGWASAPAVQAVLGDCGRGFPDAAAADPASALQAAADGALARHARMLRRAMPVWLLVIVGLGGTLLIAMLPAAWRRHAIVAVGIAAPVVPLGWMIVRCIGVDWFPTGDLALIELRTRDVGTADGSLLGPYSRYGWSHPGPLLFWVYAIGYRLTGGASSSLLAAAGACNLIAAVGTVWVAWRTGRVVLAACVTLGLALLVASLHVDSIDPWNPFVTVLPFAFLIATAWAAIEGDGLALILSVLVGSFLVQAHIGFAVPVAVLLLLAGGGAPGSADALF